MILIKRILRKFYTSVVSRDRIKTYINNGLVVGKNFNLHYGVLIDPCFEHHIQIGDDVTLAPNVHIIAHDASTKKYLNFTRLGKIKIGNRVFVGA